MHTQACYDHECYHKCMMTADSVQQHAKLYIQHYNKGLYYVNILPYGK